MKVIGLTGGIACGKSTVSGMLAGLGASIVDADKLARAVLEPGAAGYAKVLERFGADLLEPGGTINRRALGARVFEDEGARRALEGIIHPLVYAAIDEALCAFRAAGARIAVADIPLLYETNAQGLCDEVWVVCAPKAVQIQRIIARDGLTKAEAEARIKSQMPLEEKIRRADRVIDTSISFDDTRAQVEAIWQEVMG